MGRFKKLKDEAKAKASGRLKDLAGKAKQLETVLTDLKSRDFIQSPKIQELMAKVTVKGLKNVPFTKQSAAKKAADASEANASGKSKTKEKTFKARLKALETQVSPKIAQDLIQTIMKRADEIRSSYFKPSDSKTDVKKASGAKPASKKTAGSKTAAGSKQKPKKTSAKKAKK